MPDRLGDLQRLAEMRKSGDISQDEYNQLKAELLSEKPTPQNPSPKPTSQPTPTATPQKPTWQRTGFWLIVALLILVVLAQGLGSESTEGDTSSQGDEVGAFVVCQQFVEDRLVSPATAEYGDTYSDATTSLGGGRYRVETYVDSENSFGATLRSDFTCVVSHVSGDRYELESLDFDE